MNKRNEVEKRNPDPNRPALNANYPNLKVKEKKFINAEEMAEHISEFFFHCDNNMEEVMSASGAIKEIKRPLVPTVHALAAWLGVSLECLNDYCNNEPYKEFHGLLKYVKDRILAMKTMALVNGKGSTQGLIFDLKNNHNWKDKVETDNKNEHIIRVEYE